MAAGRASNDERRDRLWRACVRVFLSHVITPCDDLSHPKSVVFIATMLIEEQYYGLFFLHNSVEQLAPRHALLHQVDLLGAVKRLVQLHDVRVVQA